MGTKYIIDNANGDIPQQVIYGAVNATTFSATTYYGDGSNLSGITITPSYKVYTALLTQTGTTAPVAKVLENTLGGTLVWTRNGDGQYVATLAGAFLDENKFFTLNSITEFIGANIVIYWGNSNMFQLNTYTGNGQDMPYLETDGILYNYPIEIRVYN
jgi:hypothetical protein